MNQETRHKLEEMGVPVSILERLDVHANLPVVEELQAIRKALEALAKKEAPKMEFPAPNEVQKVELKGVSVVSIKGDKGDPGEDATPPTKEELTSLIKPLIPKPIPGKDGRDGRDGKDGIGKDGKDGEDADEAKIVEKIENDLPQLGERIRDSLELLQGEDRLDKKAIKGLDEELREIRSLPRGGGASRRVFIPYRSDLSGQCDGSNKTFYLDRSPLDEGTVMLYGTDFPVILRPTIDFTIAGKTLTLTAAVPAPNEGATLLVTYFA